MHSTICIAANFVHAYHKYHLLWSLRNRRDAICISVDVYENPVLSHRVDARQKHIGIVARNQSLARVFVCPAIDEVIVAALERVNQLRLFLANLIALLPISANLTALYLFPSTFVRPRPRD